MPQSTFTGYAEDDQAAQLVDTSGSSLQSIVMKASHRGSNSSTSGDLLDAASPPQKSSARDTHIPRMH